MRPDGEHRLVVNTTVLTSTDRIVTYGNHGDVMTTHHHMPQLSKGKQLWNGVTKTNVIQSK